MGLKDEIETRLRGCHEQKARLERDAAVSLAREIKNLERVKALITPEGEKMVRELVALKVRMEGV